MTTGEMGGFDNTRVASAAMAVPADLPLDVVGGDDELVHVLIQPPARHVLTARSPARASMRPRACALCIFFGLFACLGLRLELRLLTMGGPRKGP